MKTKITLSLISVFFIVIWAVITIWAFLKGNSILLGNAGSVGTVGIGLALVLDSIASPADTKSDFWHAFSTDERKAFLGGGFLTVTTLQWGFGSMLVLTPFCGG